MQMRVRLLKEHASHPIGAVLVLPRDEAARLHRLEVCLCLDEVPAETVAAPVLPAVMEEAKDEPEQTERPVRRARKRK